MWVERLVEQDEGLLEFRAEGHFFTRTVFYGANFKTVIVVIAVATFEKTKRYRGGS